jgi:hypothetical protein
MALPAVLEADKKRVETPKIEPDKVAGTVLLIEDEEMVNEWESGLSFSHGNPHASKSNRV